MPRERTTWNRDEIAKRASHSKSADPYLMNQDHVSKNPPADKYVIGDPSTFAEDVHPSSGTWRAEYSGDQVKRNEIGMPEYRKDTFNHPEKTANEASMIAKASLAVTVSRAMLPKTATESAIEAQATSLMHLPEVELAATYKRLVAEQEDDEGQDQGQQDKQAQDQDQGQQAQDKQGGELPPALQKFNEEKKKDDDKGDDKEDKKAQQQDQGQQQDKQAQQTQVAQLQQQLAQMQTQVAQLLAQAQQQVQPQVVQAQQDQGQQDQGQQQDKQAQQDQGQQQQDQGQQDKQAAAARIQKAMADAIASGADPVKAAFDFAQGCMGQPMGQQQSDAQLIDDMLAQQAPVVSDMGIEMGAPTMDMGEFSMTANDDLLMKQLFANQESDDAQQAQQDQGQQKQAAIRTASTRTVGTRPTAGVSQLGGLPSTSKKDDVSNLSSMWSSAPDVSSAFGMTGR